MRRSMTFVALMVGLLIVGALLWAPTAAAPSAIQLEMRVLLNGEPAYTAPGPSIEAGSPVLWTYVLYNSGTIKLKKIAVTDQHGLAVSCPKATLNPSESMVCMASGAAEEGYHRYTATANAAALQTSTASAQDVSQYTGVVPTTSQGSFSLVLEKLINGQDADSPPGPVLTQGAAIVWSYVVVNTGAERLSSVSVTDDQGVTISCPKTTLEPGESMVCTGSGSAAAGAHQNTGTARGFTSQGSEAIGEDVCHYVGGQASISIEKRTNGTDADTPPGPELVVGSTILWTYVVVNNGDQTLTNVTVTDSRGVAVSCPKTMLVPAESMTCGGSGTATAGQYSNIGTAVGTPSQGGSVSAQDPSHYYGVSAGNQGCTPGYWKNHTGSWPPTGYSPPQTIASVFAEALRYPALGGSTLHQGLAFGGGSGVEGAAEILLRAGVAALLNASHPDVAYPRTPASVIADVNSALASGSRDTMLALAAQLDADNNRGCPLS